MARPGETQSSGGAGAELTDQQPRVPPITAEEFQELAWQGVPFVRQLGWRLERFAAGDVAVRLPYSELLLRPGGTICGPALMALADVTLYGLVLSMIGSVEGAVTTNLSVHFLHRRRPPTCWPRVASCGSGGAWRSARSSCTPWATLTRSATLPGPTRSRRRRARAEGVWGTAFRRLQSM
jgi:acyl-coenzyme A thioesterase PaaI-like protein